MTILRPQVSDTVPGLLLAAAGTAVASAIGTLTTAVSPLLIGIVLGMICANAVALPDAVRPGLAIVSRTVLRIGVALLGLQLVLGDILGLGAGVIVLVVVIVAGGIGGTLWIGRLLGVPFAQRLLIACGSSICGAAAVAAVDGVVDADEEDVATAVACVVVFGTLMIPTVPFLASALGLSDDAAGLWAGGSIHEVAQVVAAGGILGSGALAVAVVVKLARVVLLAPVLAVISIRRRTAGADAGAQPPLIPLFVVGFVVLVALRSTGVVPAPILSVGKELQTIALTAAMFALGAGIRVSTLRSVGARPFLLAACATGLVGAIGLGGALILG